MTTDTISAPDGATTFSTNSDAEMIASWERWSTALTLYNEPRTTVDGPQEEAWFNTICAEEDVMRQMTATTARGTECQLWTAIENITNGAEASLATARADLDHFLTRDLEHDWEVRLILAALKSLRAQHEAEAAFAAAWLAAWTKDGGSVVIDDEGKAQIGWVTYDFSPSYRAPDPAWPDAVRDNTFLHAQAHHDATMKARFDALKMFPGGVDALKAHMQAKGFRVAVHTTEHGK